ncbi:hypothetical protein FRC12_001025 [Ceratobasidium sp. 428]|nr:hypothetical protein FRC12_001025 [Ceratobasidium sp. 428]
MIGRYLETDPGWIENMKGQRGIPRIPTSGKKQVNCRALVGTPHDTRLRVVKRRIGNKRYQRTIGKARLFVYELGHSVQSKDVEALLKGESYVPTMRLGNKFNIYSALVVDQLHEVELGVWKAVFKHLVRLVHLNGSTSVIEFDRRLNNEYSFRTFPTFGPTIRLFAQDVSSMSRKATRDFEDILQGIRLHFGRV